MSSTTRVPMRVLFCLLMIPAVFAQESFTHEPSGLTFTLPAGWTYSHEGDHFEAASSDESIVLLFFVGKSYEVEAAINGAVDELSKIIRNVNVTTDVTEVEVNGLNHAFIEGDGLMEGEVIDWDLTVVQGSRKCMAIVALGDIDSYQGIVDKIYDSIRE